MSRNDRVEWISLAAVWIQAAPSSNPDPAAY